MLAFPSSWVKLKIKKHRQKSQFSTRYLMLFFCCIALFFGAFNKLPWVDPEVLTQVSPWQELMERSHSPSRGDGMHLRSPPSDPLHKQGTRGWPGWARSKLFERTRADRGRPREANRTRTQYVQSFMFWSPSAVPAGTSLLDRRPSELWPSLTKPFCKRGVARQCVCCPFTMPAFHAALSVHTLPHCLDSVQQQKC